LASASAGVIGLAGLPYRIRRGLTPDGTSLIDELAPTSAPALATPAHVALPAAEPSFRAPWGELERELPYVTITTQPWPEEWWRPSARAGTRASAAVAATAIARATDRPSERVAASTVAIPVDSTPHIAIAPLAQTTPDGDIPAPDTRSRRATRTEVPRRGFLARMALVAAGLVLSLIAVESASRRRH
jgi:hypothetical protein